MYLHHDEAVVYLIRTELEKLGFLRRQTFTLATESFGLHEVKYVTG